MTIWERITAGADGGGMSSIFSKLASLFGGDGGHEPSAPHHQVAFTIAVVALGAKIAKADGQVTPDEVAAFKEVFKVEADQAQNVAKVFDLAKQDVAGYEGYADQLGRLFKDNRPLLQDVLEGLFHIASADGVIFPEEDEYLKDVAARFGFAESEYRFIRSRFVVGAQVSPYEVLEMSLDATDDAIKAQYRKLVSENHPDRYIARGMPAEAIEIANRKLAAINEAYDTIARERGLK
jgi:DnaJ like chaperone protein